MDFDLTDVHVSWRDKGRALGREVANDPSAGTVVMGAARFGLLGPAADLVAAALAVEALACESPTAGVTLALHTGGALAVARDPDFSSLFRGETVAAVALSADDLPVEANGRLSGRASWVAPVTESGLVIVGAQKDSERVACAVSLDAPGVTIESIDAAALSGLTCAHVTFANTVSRPVGPTAPIMTRLRILMAAAGLGLGRRACREALTTARAAHVAAAGEQTVQGLLADTATELDAAMLMIWKAASSRAPSLGEASLAKLMVTGAAQRAVERATQVVGVDSFRRGHILERCAQDVRALELFAGRTEALRAAAAEELLPRHD